MVKQITRQDIVDSVRDQLSRQRIIEKEGFYGLIVRQANSIQNIIDLYGFDFPSIIDKKIIDTEDA